MPKIVDHQQRRTSIAEALLRVAAERGLDSVSLRHVAAEAGVSAGMVQHYFRTKDEMMAFALGVISENVELRMTAALEALGESPSSTQLCRALLSELLPLDEPRRLEGQVALAFLAYRATHPAIAAAREERRGAALLRDHLAELIRSEQKERDDVRTLDVEATATALLALVEGLSLQALGDQYTPADALAVFDTVAPTMLGS